MSIPEKATKRLQNELKMMINESPDFVTARPLENNILEWHYVIKGPKDTPYEGGEYHGTVIFPKEYPFKPPSIRMITPNGRFQPNARICLTISDYHPESWNPGWNILTILIGLVSFMSKVENNYAAGCVNSNESQKKRLLRNLDHSIEATRPLNVTGSLQLKLVLLQDLVDSKLTVDVSSDESSSSTKAKDKKRKMENDCEVIIVQDEKKKKEEKEEDIIVIDD